MKLQWQVNPYTDPVPNWANSKFMLTQLKPTGK